MHKRDSKYNKQTFAPDIYYLQACDTFTESHVFNIEMHKYKIL